MQKEIEKEKGKETERVTEREMQEKALSAQGELARPLHQFNLLPLIQRVFVCGLGRGSGQNGREKGGGEGSKANTLGTAQCQIVK